MSSHHGRFVWYELMTTDLAAAEAFYRAVVGWTMQDAGVPGMAYTLLHVGETQVGGMMALPKEASDAGAKPAWMGYVAVDDVDACAAKLVAKGGALQRPAEDIPEVGRFAVVADPHGAGFMLFKGMGDAEPPPVMPNAKGYVGWRELMAGDLESDFAFYADLFGWTKGDVMSSPDGPYQLFRIGGEDAGGMMTKPAAAPWPMWNYYFTVEGVDSAIERVKAGGGSVIAGPMEVPGEMWVAHAFDPQGAVFCLLGPKG